jgi:hypothetical protein
MADNDRPLPTPPRSRFGRDPQQDAGPAPGMISDRMALAAAEGRLEEFLQHEIPEGDHARTLARMMMGMSGMMPMGAPAGATHAAAPPDPGALPAGAADVPPEVLAAVQQGDVATLKGILRAEHAKRSGRGAAAEETPPEPSTPAASAPLPAAAAAPAPAGIDTAVIDELIRIGAANDVTVDWLMLRAVKLYVEEYRKTGRL